MLKRYSRIILLLTTILSFICLAWTFMSIPPDTSLELGIVSLSIILLFLPLCFIFVFGVVALITKRYIFGVLVATVCVVLLIFRLLGLTHPLFLVLILGIFITALLFFKKDKTIER